MILIPDPLNLSLKGCSDTLSEKMFFLTLGFFHLNPYFTGNFINKDFGSVSVALGVS